MPNTSTNTKASSKKKELKPLKTKTILNPSQLSTEFVQDSDESEAPTKPTSATGPTKPKSGPIQSSWSQKAAKSAVGPTKKPPKKEKPSSGSNPREGQRDIAKEHDGSSSSTRPAPSQARPKSISIKGDTSKPVARPSVSPVSSKKRRRSESVSAQISSVAEDVKSDKVGTNRTEGSSNTSAESCSESGHQSEEEESSQDGGSVQATAGMTQPPVPPTTKSIPPFEAPEGFEVASIASVPHSGTNEIFSPKNLEGKQIWHITVPASVPIGSVQEVSAKSIQDGSSILSHKGASYGLVSKSGNDGTSKEALLLPSSRNNDYRPCITPISDSWHLQQLVRLPTQTTASDTPVNTSNSGTNEPTRPRNEQPQGLKMRYHAFGLTSDSDLDSATPTQRPQFQHPNLTASESQPKKRKRTEADDHNREGNTPVVKHKKAKVQASPVKDDHEDKASAMDVDTDIVSRSPEKGDSASSKTVRVKEGAVPAVGQPNGVESKEDRAKRKPEKKRLQPSQPENVSQSSSPSKIANSNGITKNQTSLPRQPESGTPELIDVFSTEEPKQGRKKPKDVKQQPPTSQDSISAEAASSPGNALSNGITNGNPLPTKQQPELLQDSSRPLGPPLTKEEKEAKEERKKRREEKRRRKEALAARIAGGH